MRALNTAATGMMAQELNVQVIANNIANMRTTGYKRQRAEFQDLHLRARAAHRRAGLRPGQHPAGRHRARLRRQDRRHAAADDARHAGADRQQARRRHPGRRLVQDPDARRHLQPTPATARSRWIRKAASSPPRATSCSRASPFRRTRPGSRSMQQGQVSVTLPGSTTSTMLGQFTLTRFINNAGLQANGNNLFRETPASGTPQDGTARHQRRRHAAAGQPRTGQRRGGDRNFRPDRRAARLRDEFQGHHRRRSDAADNIATDALRKVLP